MECVTFSASLLLKVACTFVIMCALVCCSTIKHACDDLSSIRRTLEPAASCSPETLGREVADYLVGEWRFTVSYVVDDATNGDIWLDIYQHLPSETRLALANQV